MSKFNDTQRNVNDTDTVNLAGGAAYSMSPELEFASIMVTAMLEDQYYRTGEDTMKRMRELMGVIPDKKFIAQAAVYARTEFNMRSVSHYAAAQLATMPEVKGTNWIRNFYNRVVVRPDDMAEIISAIGSAPLPNSLKRGFADRMTKFDEYQLAKYALKGKDVNMVDIVRLVHPKPTEAITKLVNGTLEAPETWEVKLTQAGQAASSAEELETNKAEAWKSLILNRKMGYMALMRNLRNINESLGTDKEVVAAVCAQLTNEKLVANSKLFPFRFYTAVRECSKIVGFNRDILNALNKAMELSVNNVPKFDGRTLVIVDISGSMSTGLSRKSTVQCIDAAALFAAALYKSNDADIIEFGSSAHYVTGLNPADTLTTIASKFRANGGGTNVQGAFNLVTSKYDRIILLSDMQCWMADKNSTGYMYGWGQQAAANLAMPELRKRTNTDPYLYSFDLAAGGTLQFPESKVACVAGYDDKVFEIMKLAEQDKQALVNEIRKVVL